MKAFLLILFLVFAVDCAIGNLQFWLKARREKRS